MLSKKISRFLTIATLTTLTCIIANPSNAQTAEVENINEYNVEELVNEVFWREGGDFFRESRPRGFLNIMFGWKSFPLGSYPENQITEDSLMMYTILTDYYKQLSEKGPTIRTRDLPNPYDTSINQNSDYVR